MILLQCLAECPLYHTSSQDFFIIVILKTVLAFQGYLVSQVAAGGLPSLDVFSQLIHVLGDWT